MNNKRRKAIKEIKTELEELKDQFECLAEQISNIYCEEDEYLENIPENLHNSERYERVETSCQSLESAKDNAEYALDTLGEVLDLLEEACEI